MSEILSKTTKIEMVTVTEVSIKDLAQATTIPELAKLLDNYLNLGSRGFPEGLATGKVLRESHRTIQRLVVCWALGVLCGLAEQDYTDARNEEAIATAQKIKEMITQGELSLGMFI